MTSLNAALVMLRSVTNVLNTEGSRRVPDFEAWYAPHIKRYTDPVMRWLVTARNVVEKQGDLELHSQARVTLLGGPGEPPQADIPVPPLLTQHEIAQFIAPRFSEEVRRNGLLAVERRWVAADLPEQELLDVLAYGYGVIAEIVADAHTQCGVLMQTFGDEAHEDRPIRRAQLGGRLSCMVAHSKLRTAYVHLAQGEVVEWGTRTHSLTRDDVEGWELPEGMLETVEEHVPGTHILDTAERLARAAKAFAEHSSYHHPMAWIFETRDSVPEICLLNARDHATQTLMMQAVADDVERLRAEGVVFVSEIRQPSGAGSELLLAAMTDDGGKRQWRSPISRDPTGSVKIGRTVAEDGAVPDFMNAIRRVWIRLGRLQL